MADVIAYYTANGSQLILDIVDDSPRNPAITGGHLLIDAEYTQVVNVAPHLDKQVLWSSNDLITPVKFGLVKFNDTRDWGLSINGSNNFIRVSFTGATSLRSNGVTIPASVNPIYFREL